MVNLDNLFSLIEESGLKTTVISKKTGISTGNISDWKSGRSMPSAIKLDVLADYFHVSIDYLLGRDEQKNNAAVSIAENSDTQKLFENYNLLNENAQKELLNYLEYMITKPENLKQDEGKRAV